MRVLWDDLVESNCGTAAAANDPARSQLEGIRVVERASTAPIFSDAAAGKRVWRLQPPRLLCPVFLVLSAPAILRSAAGQRLDAGRQVQ